MRFLAAATGVWPLCIASVGCNVYHPELWLEAAAESACRPRRPPARPEVDSGGGPTLVWALRDIEFDQSGERWAELGYDIDGACTSDQTTASCVPPSGLAARVDGPDGVDNVLGQSLFPPVLQYLPALQVNGRRDQAAGAGAIVLMVKGYSGARDDRFVDAFITISVRAEAADEAATPRWDGSDTFYGSAGNFVDGQPERPMIRDRAAYVRDRVLVMAIPDGASIRLPWSESRLDLVMQGGQLTGTIEPGGALSAARLSGRMTLNDIDQSLTAAGMCPGSSERIAVDQLLEGMTDVTDHPANDGLDLPCSALSFSLGFRGVAANWGGLATVPRGPRQCVTP